MRPVSTLERVARRFGSQRSSRSGSAVLKPDQRAPLRRYCWRRGVRNTGRPRSHRTIKRRPEAVAIVATTEKLMATLGDPQATAIVATVASVATG